VASHPAKIVHADPRHQGSADQDCDGIITATGSVQKTAGFPTDVSAVLNQTDGSPSISAREGTIVAVANGGLWTFTFDGTVAGHDYVMVVSADTTDGQTHSKSQSTIVFKAR
jgi:hypothetical protein